MCYLYTTDFCAATKKNKILSLARKWMEVENIILSEVARLRRQKAICSLSVLNDLAI
jgi:hypothetical protein